MADTNISPNAGDLRLATRRPEIVIPGLTQAISGIARSGCTYSGDTTATVNQFPEYFDVLIDDDMWTSSVDVVSLSITQGLSSEPSQLSCEILNRSGLRLERGHDIQIWVGGIGTGVALFTGTVMQATEQFNRSVDDVIYSVRALDYRWLLDRFDLVNAVYLEQGFGTIVSRIISDFTDPLSGFALGYVPSSLGKITEINFNGVRVSQALQRLTDQVDGGGHWTIGHDKHISLFDTPHATGNTLSVADGGDWRQFRLERDLTQVRNRVCVIGGGSKTTAVASQGAATIAVDETSWFNPSGGTVRAGVEDVTYTGISVNNGPGNLTGVSGLTMDLEQGASIRVVSQVNDTSAQTDLSNILAGQSGVAIHEESISQLTYDEADKAAAGLLDQLATPNEKLTYSIAPYPLPEPASPVNENVLPLVPGRTITLNITKPFVANGTYRITSVELAYRSNRSDGVPVFDRTVTAQLVVSGGARPAFSRAVEKSLDGVGTIGI